jgi:hypothetical protein
MKKYLILSPYAENGTKNSGDDLIVKSLIELLKFFSKKTINYDIVSIAKSTLNKENKFNKININKYNAILVPGFRITIERQEILDIRLKYIEKAIINNIPIFLLGSSWCISPGTIKQTKLKINPKEKALLKYIINDKKSLLTTRDIYTKLLLKNNNLVCSMTGDIALFDVNYLFTRFVSSNIRNIAISLPHNITYYKYCFQLKEKLQNRFNVCITTHQSLNNKLYKNLSGNYQNLNYYRKFDMHIGFRLHGHLWFLRNRKPSLLIAEDGRGNGNLKTFSNAGFHINKIKKDINSIIELMNNEINNDFEINKKVMKEIDKLWDQKVKNIILRILEV